MLTICAVHASPALQMEVGYWKSEVDMSSNTMMQEAMKSLAKMPKSIRDKVIQKMGGSGNIKKFYNCVTTKDLKDGAKKLMNTNKSPDCKMVVTEINSKGYDAEHRCKNNKMNSKTVFRIINEKSAKAHTTTAMSPGPIKIKMSWVSSNCPKT